MRSEETIRAMLSKMAEIIKRDGYEQETTRNWRMALEWVLGERDSI